MLNSYEMTIYIIIYHTKVTSTYDLIKYSNRTVLVTNQYTIRF